jgi:hypothetical protein
MRSLDISPPLLSERHSSTPESNESDTSIADPDGTAVLEEPFSLSFSSARARCMRDIE